MGVTKRRHSRFYRGSFALLEAERPLLKERDFKLGLWIWPTLPRAGSQGLVSWRDRDTQGGLALALDEMGRVAARMGDRELVRSREALSPRAWVHIQLEAREGRVFLSVAPRDFSPRHALPDNSEAPWRDATLPFLGRDLSSPARRSSSSTHDCGRLVVSTERSPGSALPWIRSCDVRSTSRSNREAAA